MIEEEIPEADEEFLSWIKRPVILNAKKAKELIEELSEAIIYYRSKLQPKSRIHNNGIYCQIANRERQIKHASTFL